jgi:hypothetical protein
MGDLDCFPILVAKVDVDSTAASSDPAVDLVLVPLKNRLSREGLSRHLQGVGINSTLRPLEVLMSKPHAEGLAADAMGLAVSADDNVCECIAIRRGGVKEGGRVGKPDQDVRLLLALLASAIFLL